MEPKKLRFDFTYGKPLSNDQLLKVEEWINDAALSGGETNVQVRRKKTLGWYWNLTDIHFFSP